MNYAPAPFLIRLIAAAGLLPASLGVAHAQLVLSSTAPAANAKAAPAAGPVSASFNQALAAGSTAALHVFSAQRGGLRTGHSGPTTVSNNAVYFAPTYAFRPGETVHATVTTVATATAGGRLGAGKVWQFTAAAGAGLGTFRRGSTTSAGGFPHGVTVGDVDGDGDLDLLTTNHYDHNVSVRLNDGSGVFGGGTNPAVGNGPTGITVGDVDGDGDLDLLTTNQYGHNVSVRLNNGSGVFGGGSDPTVGAGPTSVVLGDVDGDGDLDLLTANYGGGTVSVRLNDGSGMFSGGSDPIVGAGPAGLAVSDVDGDGDLDLLTANSIGGTMSVRLNNGSGSFSGGADLAAGYDPYTLATGDVDGDGDLDLLIVNRIPNTASVWFNNGSGTFSRGATLPLGNGTCISLALGDVDGDGDLDLLLPVAEPNNSRVSIRLNNGSGTFGGGSDAAASTNPFNIVAGDVDGDGDIDLLMSDSLDGAVYVQLNRDRLAATGPTATPAGGLPLTIWPNPARSAVAVRGLNAGAVMQVFDALGRTVTTATADASGTARLTLPQGLAAGVYVVRSGAQVQRLTVE